MDYFPFIFGTVVMIVLNMVVQLISNNPHISSMRGASSLQQLLGFGTIVIVLFTVIFLVYSHNFLSTRRKKSFGLYNVLGMSKSDLTNLLFLETMFIYVISMLIGILSGLVFARLMFLVLLKLVDAAGFAFTASWNSVVQIAVWFFILFLFLFITGAWGIQRTKSLELLKAESMGEKEPKSRVVFTIIGFATLLTGYMLALRVERPLEAIMIFFVAVVFVILATYILFIAGSITILKLMKRNKKLFYQPKNFVSISGMLFRMKQNGVGLANISVLITMTLVTFVTTVALFASQMVFINRQVPFDASVIVNRGDEAAGARALAEQTGLRVTDSLTYTTTTIFGILENDGAFRIGARLEVGVSDMAMLVFMPYESYKEFVPNAQPINDNQLLVYTGNEELNKDVLRFGTQTFEVKTIDEIPNMPSVGNVVKTLTIVAKDQEAIQHITDELKDNEKNPFPAGPVTTYLFNVEGTSKERENFTDLAEKVRNEEPSLNISTREATARDFQVLTGGFLFIGALFGLSFIVAAGLIIYYKQISEGMSDQKRFEILQKVGMSHKEVKRTIDSQVIWIFFLPVVVAVLHTLFALPLIYRMLGLFNVQNWGVLVLATGAVVVIIGIVYFIIYKATSKTYYDLVERN